MKEKIKQFFVEKRENGLILNKQPQVFSITVLAISAVYFIVMLATRFNFLVPVAIALSMAVALFIIVDVIKHSRLNLYFLISYALLFFGTMLLFIAFGADSFGKRLGYNLLIGLVSILAFVILVILPFIKKGAWRYIVAWIATLAILASTMFYFFAMSIRLKPTVESMQEGHRAYLDQIKTMKTNPNSPNVLMIIMDDMGYADCSCYSYLGNKNATIKTPNIDSIADDGIMMSNFYSSSPVCSPARFSYFTGRYQSRGYLDNVIFPTAVSLDPFGSTRYFNPYQFAKNVDGLLGDEITYAEVFQNLGYNTSLIGKWNLGDYGEYLPTNQGFDYFYGSYYVNDMTPYNMVRERNGIAKEVISTKDLKDQSKTNARLTAEMKNVISESVNKGEKFMTCYATPWPHYPIFSGEENNKKDDNYIDCIEEFDSGVGEILQLLKDKGVYDDTLIVFTSDNGPGREGATGALRGRKNTVFDGGHKVPLVACYVNGGLGSGSFLAGGNVVESPTMIFDLFPTLLDYIGIDALPKDRIIDGVSLKALWQGEIDCDTKVHDALYYTKSGKVQGIQMPLSVTDKDGATKIVDFKYYEKVHSENSAFIDQFYKNYLFDLDKDPIEAYNVSMVHPDTAKEMLASLKKFRKELKENRRGIIR